MKKTLSLIPLLGLVFCGCSAMHTGTTPPGNPDHAIAMTFAYNFADAPACSASVTKSCISGFQEGYLQGTTLVQLHTDTTAVCTGTTQPLACTTNFNAVIPIGSLTFYVTATGLDQNGAATTSTAANSSAIQVGADAPSNVNVTVSEVIFPDDCDHCTAVETTGR